MSFISPVATDTNGKPKQTGSMQSLGKDDFLQLLVTKLQHQDPMNPQDDAEYISQLAQFSSLEQMKNISDGISASNQWDFLQMQSLNNAMASGLIGKEVRAEYNGVYVENGKSATVSFTMEQPAASVQFKIIDSEGNVVATVNKENVNTGIGSFTWDGKDTRGNAVAAGYYKIEATATGSNGTTFKPSLSVAGIVDKITYRDGSSYVNIDGVEIALGDLTAVGAPGSFDTK